MKRILLLLVSLFSLSSLSGCNNDDAHRYIYLACKFKLSQASINTTYVVSDSPAYYKQIPGNTDCISCFNRDESFYTLNTKIIDGKAVGYGSVCIKTTTNEYKADFNYNCIYNSVYGGQIVQTSDTQVSFLGKQIVRGRYQYVRMEAFLPDVSDKRLVIEFYCVENLETDDVYNAFHNEVY